MNHSIYRVLPGVMIAAMLLIQPVRGGYETTEPVDFELPALGGGVVSLSEFRGQWVVVNYWATWCGPCRKEIPELAGLHRERDDVTVLGLAFEDPELASFEDFLADFEVTYPILLVDVYDPPEPFGAPKVLPTTFLLDPDGRSRKSFFGPVTRQEIEDFIAEAGALR